MWQAQWLAGLVLAVAGTEVQAAAPVLGGCGVLPANNPWNTPVAAAAVHPDSATWISNILANGGDFLHPDFGSNPDYGIPWTTVGAGQPLVPVNFVVADESTPGPYPIPADAPVEGGSDRHVLVVDTAACTLYEIYAASYGGNDTLGWQAYSGAVWPLGSNAQRPDKWTSADAAGLPILPGLARCEEASSGSIAHALRFTVSRTRKAYAYPASHYASSQTAAAYPPMGLRLRLKAAYDTSALDGQAGAIATALKTYGMILADNGSNWFVSGETNPGCWDDEDLDRLKGIPGSAFEVVVSPPPPSEVPGDLLANGGFEAARPATVRPESWVLSGAVTRVCNEPEYGYRFAFQGQCGASLVPGAGTESRLSQTVTNPPPGPLRLRLRARPRDLPPGGASAMLIVVYSDATQKIFTFPLPDGTATGYLYRSFDVTPNPAKTVASVRLRLSHLASSGRLALDQVALVSVP